MKKSEMKRRKREKRESELMMLPKSELRIILKKKRETIILSDWRGMIDQILWREGLTEKAIKDLEKLEREGTDEESVRCLNV